MSLLTPSLTETGAASIDRLLADVVESKRVPATFLGVASAKGELYCNQAGDRVFGRPEEGKVDDTTSTGQLSPARVMLNAVLQLFSCTKLVTAVACLQLIDQGKLSLHDPDIVSTHLPELSELPILHGYDDAGGGILTKPKSKITLNMLLTHTAGLSYTFKSPLIARWSKEHGIPSMFSANPPLSAFLHPLLFEPGTQFGYSVGVDWAGFLVSRVTNMSLEDYFQQFIFRPCGMEHTSFFPPRDYAERRMGMHIRSEEDRERMRTGDHPMARSFDPADYGPYFSGGAGLFGSAKDYLRFLSAILASADPEAAAPLISAASFKLLFTDTTPLGHRTEIQASLATMAKRHDVYDPVWSASGKGESLGWSPGLFLSSMASSFGRQAGSGCWYGAASTMFWLDPSAGVAASGVCFTNLMADRPDPWNKVYNDFERLVYDHLKQ